MAVEQGMNRPVVIEVAGQLMQNHNSLIDIQHQADSAVSTLGSNWFGSDSQQYQADWGNASRMITQAADLIQQMSKTASDQASQQESTSQA